MVYAESQVRNGGPLLRGEPGGVIEGRTCGAFRLAPSCPRLLSVGSPFRRPSDVHCLEQPCHFVGELGRIGVRLSVDRGVNGLVASGGSGSSG